MHGLDAAIGVRFLESHVAMSEKSDPTPLVQRVFVLLKPGAFYLKHAKSMFSYSTSSPTKGSKMSISTEEKEAIIDELGRAEKMARTKAILKNEAGIDLEQDIGISYFAIAGGLYQYSVDFHGGQDSELYRIGCEIRMAPILFNPSVGYDIDLEENAADRAVYDLLVSGAIEPPDLLSILKELVAQFD